MKHRDTSFKHKDTRTLRKPYALASCLCGSSLPYTRVRLREVFTYGGV